MVVDLNRAACPLALSARSLETITTMLRLLVAAAAIVSIYHTMYLITCHACTAANRPVIAELHAIRRALGKPLVPEDVFVGVENSTLSNVLAALSVSSWYLELK